MMSPNVGRFEHRLFGLGHFGLGRSGLGHFGQTFFQGWMFRTNSFVKKLVKLLCQCMLKHVNIKTNSG